MTENKDCEDLLTFLFNRYKDKGYTDEAAISRAKEELDRE